MGCAHLCRSPIGHAVASEQGFGLCVPGAAGLPLLLERGRAISIFTCFIKVYKPYLPALAVICSSEN